MYIWDYGYYNNNDYYCTTNYNNDYYCTTNYNNNDYYCTTDYNNTDDDNTEWARENSC